MKPLGRRSPAHTRSTAATWNTTKAESIPAPKGEVLTSRSAQTTRPGGLNCFRRNSRRYDRRRSRAQAMKDIRSAFGVEEGRPRRSASARFSAHSPNSRKGMVTALDAPPTTRCTPLVKTQRIWRYPRTTLRIEANPDSTVSVRCEGYEVRWSAGTVLIGLTCPDGKDIRVFFDRKTVCSQGDVERYSASIDDEFSHRRSIYSNHKEFGGSGVEPGFDVKNHSLRCLNRGIVNRKQDLVG